MVGQPAARIRRTQSLGVARHDQAVTFSFMKRETAELFGFDNEALVVDNPISADLDAMRPSILPNLLEAAHRNADRGCPDVALFEVGPSYSGDGEDGQAIVAAAIRTEHGPRHWDTPQRDVDAWDAKADAAGGCWRAGGEHAGHDGRS